MVAPIGLEGNSQEMEAIQPKQTVQTAQTTSTAQTKAPENYFNQRPQSDVSKAVLRQ